MSARAVVAIFPYGFRTAAPWSLGACAEVARPDDFYADAADKVEGARLICNLCPIRNKCLQWALDAREPFGMWGGLTPYQRENLRRCRRRASCPGCGSRQLRYHELENGAHYRQVCLSCALAWRLPTAPLPGPKLEVSRADLPSIVLPAAAERKEVAAHASHVA